MRRSRPRRTSPSSTSSIIASFPMRSSRAPRWPTTIPAPKPSRSGTPAEPACRAAGHRRFRRHGAGEQAACDRARRRRRLWFENLHLSRRGRSLWASRRIGRPVKWVSDRSEAFLVDAHGRDHVTHAELALDAAGKILGMRVKTIANIGAYMQVFSSAVPTYLYATLLSGQYQNPADLLRSRRGLYQHQLGRCLPRRRTAGSDLCGRTAGGGRGARTAY